MAFCVRGKDPGSRSLGVQAYKRLASLQTGRLCDHASRSDETVAGPGLRSMGLEIDDIRHVSQMAGVACCLAGTGNYKPDRALQMARRNHLEDERLVLWSRGCC